MATSLSHGQSSSASSVYARSIRPAGGRWCASSSRKARSSPISCSATSISRRWRRSGRPTTAPELRLAGPNTVMLLASSVVMWWSERGIKTR